MVNVHNSAGLVVIEVEDEGVDAVGAVEIINREAEPGAECTDGHGCAGIVERVPGTEVEERLVLAACFVAAVGTDEGDGAVIARDALSCGVFIYDGDTVEHRVDDVVAARPLHDIGLASLNRVGIHKVEREGFRGSVVTRVASRTVVQSHHRGAFKWCAREIIDIERQAQRVPVAIPVECSAVEGDSEGTDIGCCAIVGGVVIRVSVGGNQSGVVTAVV